MCVCVCVYMCTSYDTLFCYLSKMISLKFSLSHDILKSLRDFFLLLYKFVFCCIVSSLLSLLTFKFGTVYFVYDLVNNKLFEVFPGVEVFFI